MLGKLNWLKERIESEIMSITQGCISEVPNEIKIKLLDVDVLKRCGVLVFNLFKRSKDEAILESYNIDTLNISYDASYYSEGDTYIELVMRKTFDELYDTMSHDLEKADGIFMVPSKLQLYDDLNDFIQKDQLHQINRYRLIDLNNRIFNIYT